MSSATEYAEIISKQAQDLSALRAVNAELVEALRRIARAEADGLDGARDTIVLERAIGVARTALAKVAS